MLRIKTYCVAHLFYMNIKFHPRHFFCFFFFEMNSSLTANAARVAHREI